MGVGTQWNKVNFHKQWKQKKRILVFNSQIYFYPDYHWLCKVNWMETVHIYDFKTKLEKNYEKGEKRFYSKMILNSWWFLKIEKVVRQVWVVDEDIISFLKIFFMVCNLILGVLWLLWFSSRAISIYPVHILNTLIV